MDDAIGRQTQTSLKTQRRSQSVDRILKVGGAYSCSPLLLGPPPRSDDGGGLMRKRDKDPGQKSRGVAPKQLKFYQQSLSQRIRKKQNYTGDISGNSFMLVGALTGP